MTTAGRTTPVRARQHEERRQARSALTVPADVTAPPWAVGAVRLGAAVGAAVLAGTSTGSTVIAAALLAVALADRRAAVAAGLVVVAVAVRFGTTSLDHLAGLQEVLGSAVRVGPATGAASAWLCAAALVLVAGRVPGAVDRFGLDRHVPALAIGTFAAAVAVGSGPGGELGLRVAATIVFTVAAWLMAGDPVAALARRRRSLAVLAAIAAVVCAGWPT